MSAGERKNGCTEGRIVPTAEEWKEIEDRLSGFYGTVVLRVDGYKITLQVQRIKVRQYAIMLYVEGVFKGKWLGEDCEERRRFCCPRTKFLWSRENRRLGKKAKQRLKSINIDMDKKYIWHTPYWTSFKALKAHLLKNNVNIEYTNPMNATHASNATNAIHGGPHA